jgi:hypothetical protein
MATIDIKARIDDAVVRSNELEQLVAKRQPFPLRGDRQMLIAGYWALMVDYHRSVLYLLKLEPSPRIAVARPGLSNPLYRAHIRTKARIEAR